MCAQRPAVLNGSGRGLVAKHPAVSMLRKRIGATLKALHNKGLVREDGHVDGLTGWRLCHSHG